MCVGVMKVCRITEKLNANRMKFKCGSCKAHRSSSENVGVADSANAHYSAEI